MGKLKLKTKQVIEFDKMDEEFNSSEIKEMHFSLRDVPVLRLPFDCNPFIVYLMENGKTFDTIPFMMDTVK